MPSPRSSHLCSAALGLALGLVLAAPAAAGGSEPAWPPIGTAAEGWDVLEDAPADVAADPDLRRWGVRSRLVRFYTRMRGSGVESCGVELWHFVDRQHAMAAERGFAYPDWRIERVGDALLMLHGGLRGSEARPRRGVGRDCARIGAAVREGLGSP